MARLVVIGLTGQTGAGKSTVAALFAAAGWQVIDCDAVARQTTRPGAPCLEKIKALYGRRVFLPNGALDRAAVAKIVFSDKEELARYTAVCYPFIIAEIEKRLEECARAGAQAVLLDAPTLFESGADRFCAAVVSVVAPAARRKERILARDGISPRQAARRMQAQPEDAFYRAASRYLIENDETPQKLREKTRLLLGQIARDFDLDLRTV